MLLKSLFVCHVRHQDSEQNREVIIRRTPVTPTQLYHLIETLIVDVGLI